MKLRAVGLDLGISGKSAITTVEGDEFQLTCLESKAIMSIDAPEVERWLVNVVSRFNPDVVLMEINGPGGIFYPYVTKNHPTMKLATIDPQAQLPEEGDIMLWNEAYRISCREFLNIRAGMYWVVRLLMREQRLKFLKEYPEMFSQLSSLRWDHDTNRGDKIYMISKKKLKLKNLSDLDDEPFSKSPDMADSLALAVFGYTLLYQQYIEGMDGESEEIDEIYAPKVPGLFDLTPLDMEYAEVETL